MLDKNHHSAEIFINLVEKDINNKKKKTMKTTKAEFNKR